MSQSLAHLASFSPLHQNSVFIRKKAKPLRPEGFHGRLGHLGGLSVTGRAAQIG
jgi:hypothetical protein